MPRKDKPDTGSATKVEHVVVKTPLHVTLFLKIAEPRVIRILQLIVYVASFWAGILVIMHRPEQFLQVLGDDLATVFGMFIVAGSFVGAIAVLPGIWWLERVGIILLATCACVYMVILAYLNATPVAGGFVIGFTVCLIQRWIDIRGAQLAPREV